MTRFIEMSEELHDYMVRVGTREDAALAGVRERTAAMGEIARLQIAPDQGAFMSLLAGVMGARRALEIGTFTGYSAISVARGMGPEGRLVCCELDAERAELARANFEGAGVAERIEIRLGPAAETLAAMIGEGAEQFDLAFIDADKESYPEYYEACLKLIRPGGLILLDNVLMNGRVLDPGPDDEGARAVVELNERIHADERVEIAMVGIADGLTLARKRERG